ncbi:MAG: hypothetical protein LBL58_13850 [Tannerellaceae bacterium]|jgi:hypothetical protein|nr:hypothetical protein [Tannerellaceae bacterium]
MTRKFFKITSVSRDDLKEIGFDVSKVDDEVMVRLARRLADDYCEQLFWGSLEIIAEDYCKIPRIWDSWFKGLGPLMLEKITGYRQTNFSSEDNYRDFVNAYENWWNSQPNSYRKEIYEQYNHI